MDKHTFTSQVVLAAVMATALFSAVCPAGAAPRKGSTAIVILDNSDSMRDAAAKAADRVKDVFEAWLPRAMMFPGSRFMVFVPGNSRSTAAALAQIEVPQKWGPNILAKKRVWKDSVKAALMSAVDSCCASKERGGSDLISAVSLCADVFADFPGHDDKRITIISDMRQASKTGKVSVNFECEATIPEKEHFLKTVRDAALVPDLKGVVVSCYGMHNKSVKGSRCRFTATQAEKIRDLWMGYWQETGATVEGMRSDL